jgi:type IV fimbrial biogenesis protein FimT
MGCRDDARELLDCAQRRWMLKPALKTKSAGFTLVELMITVAVLAILMAVAMPSFTQMLRNSEVSNAAESISNGMQRARAEAVARNSTVRFVLGAGSSWSVVNADGSALDSRDSSEGSTSVMPTILPDGATTVTFNNLGQVLANADSSATLTQVDLQATGASRSLRVTIGAGGNAKVCDPSLASGSSPRAC